MLVVVAGIAQSGSTRLYNIVRYLCEMRFGREAVATFCFLDKAGDLAMLRRRASQGCVVVKIHGLDPALAAAADCCFLSLRDIRDSMRSHVLRYGRGAAQFAWKLQLNVAIARQWLGRAPPPHVVHFNEVDAAPAAAVARIARCLGWPVTVQQAQTVVTLVEALKRDPDSDPRSMLHQGQIHDGATGKYAETLTSEEMQHISAAVRAADAQYLYRNK